MRHCIIALFEGGWPIVGDRAKSPATGRSIGLGVFHLIGVGERGEGSQAAVHFEIGGGDKGGRRAGEPQHGVGDLFRFADAAQWVAIGDTFLAALDGDCLADQVGVNRTGRDGDDADPIAGVLDAPLASLQQIGGFDRAVGGHSAGRSMSLGAGDVDDDAALLPLHHLERVLRQERVPGKIDADDSLPELRRHFVNGHVRIRRLNRCVVDQHVETAELLHRRIDRRATIVFSGRTAVDEFNSLVRFRAGGFVDFEANYLRSRSQERFANCLADPAAAAANKGDAASIVE